MPGKRSRGSQGGPVEAGRATGPQSGRGEQRQGSHRPSVSELERHPAAQRVADDVGSVDAEFLEQPANRSRQRGRMWFLLRRKGFRVTEAREVDGEHIEALDERGNYGVEGPPGRTQAV